MKKLYVLFVILCANHLSYSQNDLCENAIVLTPTSNCGNLTTGSFSGSSISSAMPTCTPNSLQDVWYQFVASDPTMSVFLSATGGLNHGFEILQASCTGTSLVCVNNNGSGTSELNLNNNYVVGQTYYVRVLNVVGNLSTATFGICVQNYPTPTNDLCANAGTINASTTCLTVPVTFSGASTSGVPPTCAVNSSQDVWYRFTAPLPSLTIQLTAASGVNHGFQLYEGSCTSTPISCMNNFGSGTSETANFTTLTVGTTYFIRVFNFNSGLSIGNFGICAFNSTLSLEANWIENVQFYPNPVSSELKIQGLTISAEMHYFIYNQIGQKMQEASLKQNSINVSDLSTGVYFVKIIDALDGKAITRKFIKS